jgi:hypothetical protein
MNEWKPWTIGNDGAGQRRYFVYRHGVDSDGRNLSEHLWSKGGGVIRYTLAGAEKKARELNGEASNGQRLAAWRGDA